MSIDTVRQLALAFEEAEELPHFEKTSFRVKKKIFATLDIERKRAMVKLSEIDQSVFGLFDNSIIYPVPGKWGLQGATYIELDKVSEDILSDALKISYCLVAPKKLAEKYL